MRPLLVTAAIIEREGHILIAQRFPNSRFGANSWEFPGGKVEFGEDPETSLKREIKEELALDINVDKLFSLTSHVYHDKNGELHVVLATYKCSVNNGKARPDQCQDLKWIPDNPVTLKAVDWCEADIEIVEEYLKSNKKKPL